MDRKEDVGLLCERAGACGCVLLALVEVGMGSARKQKGFRRGYWL